MKTFDVEAAVITPGLPVDPKPYPKVVLGAGGNKRATWVSIGRRDQADLIKETDEGAAIFDAAVLVTKKGQPLIVAPRQGDDRALVLWRVPSGYRGSASIKAQDDVVVVASDSAWHSGRGNLGETAEILAVLRPGQYLEARRSGRRVQEDRARLVWNGEKVEVTFFASSADPFGDEEGEYI